MSNSVRLPLLAALAAGVVMVAGACGDATAPSSDIGPPASLIIVGGDLQSDTVGQELVEPLVVRVLDERERPVEGQIVNFRVTAGGGTVFAGVALTDREGEARERWTLGTVAADTQRVEARAVDTETGEPLVFGSFAAVGVPDEPSDIRIEKGDKQTGDLGSPLSDSLAVRVSDTYGNRVANVSVEWAVVEDGGTIDPSSSVTDTQGIARTGWSLGLTLSDEQSAKAWAAGLDTLTFTATPRFPVTAEFAKVAGDTQTDSVGHTLTDSLVAELHLPDGRALVGVPIEWNTVGARGNVEAVEAVTDSLGRARAIWTLGARAGLDSVFVRVPGQEVSTAFTANVLPGPPVSIRVARGNGQVAAPSTVLPDSVVVQVMDANENPVPGVTVTWAVVTGGGNIRPATATTNGAGEAQAEWELGGVAGEQSVVAVVAGLVAASFTATAGSPEAAGTISVGDFHTCALFNGTDAYCWGMNEPGQLGTGDRVGSSVPVPVIGGLAFESLSVGGRFSCGMTTGGDAYCWGRNNYGQLGTGTAASGFVDGEDAPVLTAAALDLASISAGNWPNCGVTVTGEGYCWGWGRNGERGDGTLLVETQPNPTLVLGGHTWSVINPGGYHTCGITASGETYCWGSNASGQLGTSATLEERVPSPVLVDGGHSFVAIVPNDGLPNRAHTCALTTDGEAYCWGFNELGQLGDGTNVSRSAPTPVAGGLSFSSISAGVEFTCGLALDGRAYCWGENDRGQLGDGSLTASSLPVSVSGGRTFVEIDTGGKGHAGDGGDHACALTADGAIYCWGANDYGQLGDGSTIDSSIPVKVLDPS